jgi:cytochrome c oxidase subunit III
MVAVVRKDIVTRSSPSENRYRMGMWVALAAVLMMFTSLTSAYIVRAASSTDWQPLAMPRILLLSTVFILCSSATMEIARRRLRSAMEGSYKRWLLVTSLLGVGFLVSQLMAWRQLVRQGVYITSHPHSSFFYLLTATHGVHLACGLLALAYLLIRTSKAQVSGAVQGRYQAATGAVTLYWHFMDVLWIYLFVLLFFWK